MYNIYSNMSRVKEILKNSIYQGAGKIAGIVFGIFSFALMSRYLGPTDFGVYTTAFTFVSIFATLADLGLPVVLLRILALHDPKDEKRIANLNTIRIILTVLIIGLGLLVARFLPYNDMVQKGILITSLGFLSVSFTQYLIVVFQERLKTGSAAFAEVVGRAAMFVVIALAVHNNWGLFVIFWGTAVGSFCAFALSIIFSLKLWKISFRTDYKLWPNLIRIALPLILLSLFSLIYFKVDTLLLSLIKTNTDVGIYGAAYKYMDVFVTFPALFSALVLPFFARASNNKNTKYLLSIFVKAFRAVCIAGMPLALITYLEAERIILLFSGIEFTESVDVLRLLALAVIPLFIGNLCTAVLIGIGRASLVAWVFGIAAFIGTIAYYFAIQAYTYFGAAGITVLVESFIALSTFTFVIIFAKKFPKFYFIIPILISGLGFACALYLMHFMHVILAIALSSIIYGILILITRAIKITELKDALGLTTRR